MNPGENTRKENKEVRVVMKVDTSPANFASENTVLIANAWFVAATTYKAYVIRKFNLSLL